jgi:4-hydroxy-2-oxoheptanedioate aldolase
MDLRKNRFKAALNEGRHQLGIWSGLGGHTAPEILATCGFDWVLIDAEHSPMEPIDVLPALQAISGYPEVTPIVRPADHSASVIKRLLDMGAQSLLIPFIQNRQEAEEAVKSIRYAPKGIRGMAGITRANRFGQVQDYATRANEEICLLVQAETAEALENLEDIASVDGVDGVFIGPADLAASMGFVGQPDHPDVVKACEDAIARLGVIGCPAGILTLNENFSKRCIERGTLFTAVGVDLVMVVDGAKELRKRFNHV